MKTGKHAIPAARAIFVILVRSLSRAFFYAGTYICILSLSAPHPSPHTFSDRLLTSSLLPALQLLRSTITFAGLWSPWWTWRTHSSVVSICLVWLTSISEPPSKSRRERIWCAWLQSVTAWLWGCICSDNTHPVKLPCWRWAADSGGLVALLRGEAFPGSLDRI